VKRYSSITHASSITENKHEDYNYDVMICDNRPTLFCLGFILAGYGTLLAIEQTNAINEVFTAALRYI
jgi:hypothetical protein